MSSVKIDNDNDGDDDGGDDIDDNDIDDDDDIDDEDGDGDKKIPASTTTLPLIQSDLGSTIIFISIVLIKAVMIFVGDDDD